MSSLLQLIQEAWTARMSGKIPEVRDLLARIQETASAENAGPADRSEILLLRASLSRSVLELEQAWGLIREAKAELESVGHDGSFQLSFQSGLCFDAGSRFADSLKCYQDAFRRARDEDERLLAKYNQAISLHNLGLPIQRVIQEIDELIAKQPDSRFRPGLEQIRLVELKRCLDQADFENLFGLNFNSLGQGLYIQALFQSLPWRRLEDHSKRDLFLEKSVSSEEIFLKDYRLRTITADAKVGGSGSSESTLQLRIDRVYLWTWLWMENPASAISALLAEELESFPFETAHLAVTPEDIVLLRSALSWLSPFNSKFASFAGAWENKAAKTIESPTRFQELDRLVRDAWLEGSLEDSRLDVRERFPGCEKLVDFLKGIAAPGTRIEARSGSLVIKKKDFLLVNESERVVSEPLARLVELLVKNDSVAFEEVLESSFGIRGYDSLDHGPKVHALVQRLKKLLPPEVLLKTKNERVYLENHAGKILIEELSLHEKHFPQLELDSSILGKKQSLDRQTQIEVSDRAVLISLFEKQSTFTREQIQEALGLSKATTNRHLQAWLQQGLVKRSGNGPRSRYLLA